jgi:hypothetical protein
MHRHKAVSTIERGWTECVTPDRCAWSPGLRDAHGGVVETDLCSCGAWRRTETNGQARNRGPWRSDYLSCRRCNEAARRLGWPLPTLLCGTCLRHEVICASCGAPRLTDETASWPCSTCEAEQEKW